LRSHVEERGESVVGPTQMRGHRLVECFTYGSISDVLDELQQQVWHENPDEIDWKSGLLRSHVEERGESVVGPTQMRGRVSTEFAKASTAFLLEQGYKQLRVGGKAFGPRCETTRAGFPFFIFRSSHQA
jgi:hypothetical protein